MTDFVKLERLLGWIQPIIQQISQIIDFVFIYLKGYVISLPRVPLDTKQVLFHVPYFRE